MRFLLAGERLSGKLKLLSVLSDFPTIAARIDCAGPDNKVIRQRSRISHTRNMARPRRHFHDGTNRISNCTTTTYSVRSRQMHRGVWSESRSGLSRPANPDSANAKSRAHLPLPSFGICGAGWGGRIRTSEWRNQNPLPYHLATPQYRRIAAGSPAAGRKIAAQTAPSNDDAAIHAHRAPIIMCRRGHAMRRGLVEEE